MEREREGREREREFFKKTPQQKTVMGLLCTVTPTLCNSEPKCTGSDIWR